METDRVILLMPGEDTLGTTPQEVMDFSRFSSMAACSLLSLNSSCKLWDAYLPHRAPIKRAASFTVFATHEIKGVAFRCRCPGHGHAVGIKQWAAA